MSTTKREAPLGPQNSYLLEHVQLGDEIEIWWCRRAQYRSAIVGSLLPSGRRRIIYNRGNFEDLQLANEQWRVTGDAALRVLQSRPPSLDLPSGAPEPDNCPLEVLPVSHLSSSEAALDKTLPFKKRSKPRREQLTGRSPSIVQDPSMKIPLCKRSSLAFNGGNPNSY